jgi:hypothetical protein
MVPNQNIMNQIIPFLNETKQYFIFGFTVIFIGIMLFTVIDNPAALNTQTYLYSFTILVPLIAACFYIARPSSFGLNFTTKNILTSIGLIIGLAVIFYLYSTMSAAYYHIINYVINIILFLSIMVGLAIVYTITENNLKRMDGIPGFIGGLLFYIPCMIRDFIGYLLQQYKLTPNIVFVLFIIEIILILLYIYIPKAINKVLIPKNLVLQNTPVFLDQGKITIATAEKLYPPSDPNKPRNLLDTDNPFLKNYCLSMWIFINPQNTSTASYAQETEIFNYSYTGNSTSYPKPKITYSYDPTTSKDYYHIYITQTLKHDITIVSQKWNQFVFNYSNNIVDLFINGALERSFNLTTSLPKYDITDTITIGAANGLDAAICNIAYSNNPLTSYQIANSYNLLMNNNPPINRSIN